MNMACRNIQTTDAEVTRISDCRVPDLRVGPTETAPKPYRRQDKRIIWNCLLSGGVLALSQLKL